MKILIIVVAVLFPLIAQAMSDCEYDLLNSTVGNARIHAQNEWRNRGLGARVMDLIRWEPKPEATTVVAAEAITRNLLSRFDYVEWQGYIEPVWNYKLGTKTGEPVRLIRYPNLRRANYEALIEPIVDDVSQIKEGGEYALQAIPRVEHNARSQVNPFYQGQVVKVSPTGTIYILDRETRRIFSIPPDEFVGAKRLEKITAQEGPGVEAVAMKSFKTFGPEYPGRERGRFNFMSDNIEQTRANLKVLKQSISQLDGLGYRVLDSIVILLKDGSQYGVKGPHVVTVEYYDNLFKLEVTDMGIYIPSFGHLIRVEDIIGISGAAYPFHDSGA
jgi:hypothetical protein